MRGIWRLRKLTCLGKHLWEISKRKVWTIFLLKNWRQLNQEVNREQSGDLIMSTVPLRFRNGLELAMVSGGYAGYRLLFPEIYLEKCYQPNPDFVPRKDWTVVDLGANMGFYTLQAAYADNSARVIAVEPIPAYVCILKENISRNSMNHRVQVIEAAVTSRGQSQVPMTIWFSASGEPMVWTVVPQDAKRVQTIHVPGITLAEVFERGRIDRCDLLKVDIEGAEYDIFEAVSERLWKRIHRIVMETHQTKNRNKNELVKLLGNAGFQVRTNENMLWAWK